MGVGGGGVEREPLATDGLILSRLPLKWSVHAAPALEPEGEWTQGATTAMEILKTVRYLVWARQMDGCPTVRWCTRLLASRV